jgi:hypothetical protein
MIAMATNAKRRIKRARKIARAAMALALQRFVDDGETLLAALEADVAHAQKPAEL